MARIDIKSAGGGGGGSGTVTSVAVSSTTLTVTGSPITSSGTITANIPDGYLKVGTGVTGSLQNVVDTNGTATQLFLSTTGIQATTTVQITTAATSYIDAEDNSGNNRFTVGRDPSSQLVTVDFASLPTALTTPVGAIRTATDGVTLANVMTFLENGNIGLGTDSPGSKFDVHSSGATVAQFNKTVSGNSYIQQLTAGAGKWKHGFTSSTGAFDIIDDVNSLTRLSLLNTGQLKLNAYTSTSAFTGTTAGFLAFDASGNILSVTSPATSPAGTTGAVQFNNAGAFGADSTNFFWDDTNNRLGVGTNAPTSRLQIVGATTGSGSNSFIVTDSAGTNLMNVRDDGILSLFTSAKTGQLDIQGGASSGVYAKAYNSQSDNIIRYKDYNGNTGMLLTMTGSGTGNLTVNNSTTSLNATLGIKGSGSTSATTSLLVQNSAGSTALQIKDDLSTTVSGIFSALGVGSISGTLYLGTNSNIKSNGSGILQLGDSPETGFNRLQFGGTSASFPSIKRASNNIEIKNADDTFGAGFSVGATLNASAILQADSTTKGFLPPRMTTTQKNAIATPAAGLMVYDSTLNKLCVYTTAWETITSI